MVCVKENILMLIASFIQGGSESQMVQLTGLLHDSGRYNVHVACLHPHGPLRASLDRLNLGEIPSFPITSFMNSSMLTQSRRFAAYLRAHDISLIHTHDFYSNIFWHVRRKNGGSAGSYCVETRNQRTT